MITADQFIFTLRSMFPSITVDDHGRNYWVGMPVDGASQLGDAFIMEIRDEIREPIYEPIYEPIMDEEGEIVKYGKKIIGYGNSIIAYGPVVGYGPNKLWKLNVPQPTSEQVKELWETLKDEWVTLECSLKVRELRDQLLREADVLVAKSLDLGDMVQVGKLGAYRQLLRDIPKQPGFPEQIKWPSPPTQEK